MEYKKGQYAKVNYQKLDTLENPVCSHCKIGYPSEMRRQIPNNTVAKIEEFSDVLNGYCFENMPPWYFCEHVLLPLDNDELEVVEDEV